MKNYKIKTSFIGRESYNTVSSFNAIRVEKNGIFRLRVSKGIGINIKDIQILRCLKVAIMVWYFIINSRLMVLMTFLTIKCIKPHTNLIIFTSRTSFLSQSPKHNFAQSIVTGDQSGEAVSLKYTIYFREDDFLAIPT